MLIYYLRYTFHINFYCFCENVLLPSVCSLSDADSVFEKPPPTSSKRLEKK